MCFNNGNNNCSCLWLIIIVVLICRFKTSIFFAPYWVPIKIEAPIQHRLLLTAAEKMGRVRPIFFAPVGDSP